MTEPRKVDLLSAPVGPEQHDPVGRRHDHAPTIDRDPLTGDLLVSGLVSLTLPESVDEWTAQVKALGLGIPEGYVVEMVKAYQVAWTRDEADKGKPNSAYMPTSGEKLWRCSYRILRDPRQRLASLLERVTERPARTSETADVQNAVFVHVVSDQQAAKIDGGGTDALIGRWREELDRAVERYRGLGLPVLRLAGGDCVEGTQSQGGAVRGRSDLTIDAQVELATRMHEEEVDAYLQAGAPSVTTAACPSNHGEVSRTAGTTDTALTASWDLAAARLAARVFRRDERVTWVLPEHDHMTVTLDIGGCVVGLAHGHQMGRDPKSWCSWLNGQAGARSRIGDADLLVKGHSHTFHMLDAGGGRTILSAPAMDGGSRWFEERHGGGNRARTLTFVLDGGRVLNLDGAN